MNAGRGRSPTAAEIAALAAPGTFTGADRNRFPLVAPCALYVIGDTGCVSVIGLVCDEALLEPVAGVDGKSGILWVEDGRIFRMRP